MSGVFGAIGGAFKSGGIMIRCLSRQVLRVTVTDAVTGAAVRDATIVATENGGWTRSGTTNANGVKEFVVYPGTYTVTAAKDWFLPEPATSAATAVAAGATVNVALNISELRFRLQVDANRDGAVDNTWTSDPAWTWGANGSGAIMLCNCDDDDLPVKNAGDNSDNAVNANNDTDELAPLHIVRHGSPLAPPASWTAMLHVTQGDEAFVRIFPDTNANTVEIIPSAAGNAWEHDIGALNAGGGGGYAGAQMGMEARRYAGHGWPSGEITVWLTVTKNALAGGGQITYRTGAVVKVAPWLLPDHLDEAATVYVANRGVDVIGIGGYLTSGNSTFRGNLGVGVAAANCNLVALNVGVGGDRWVQDWMEFGWSVMPGNPPVRMDVVMELKGTRAPANMVAGLRAADFGYIKPDSGAGFPRNYDAGGNLEVTPPVQDADGHNYKWGRLLFGTGDMNGHNHMDAHTVAFLDAQTVQDTIVVDTAWLEVGHVDEILSFLPRFNGPEWKQWKLLVVSPLRAYTILEAADGGTQMLRGRVIQTRNAGGGVAADQALQQSIDNFLTGDTHLDDPDLAFNFPFQPGTIQGAVLRTWNVDLVQPRIDAIVDRLRQEINLEDDDIIEVPVIFYPKQPGWNPASGDPDDIPNHSLTSLTADMVNMLVINGQCIVPKPHGPKPATRDDLFETWLTTQITTRVGGLTVRYLDDWYTYHLADGEVHCGTNTIRRPANVNNWLNSEWARWWEYVPPDA